MHKNDKCECKEVDKQYKCHGDGCGDCHEQPCTPSSGVSRYRLGKVKIWLLKGILAQFDLKKCPLFLEPQ